MDDKGITSITFEGRSKTFEQKIIKAKVRIISKLVNKLIAKIKKQPNGLGGIGGCLFCNPEYYRKGYIQGVKDLEKFILEETKNENV
jgi:hypothetical protein